MNIKDFLKEKKDQAKTWLDEKKAQVDTWLEDEENKELVKLLAPVLLIGGGAALKEFAKHKRQEREEELKTNFIYDRSNGHYYELKRQPKAKQWLEIDRRKEEGERIGEILNDMNLLK